MPEIHSELLKALGDLHYPRLIMGDLVYIGNFWFQLRPEGDPAEINLFPDSNNNIVMKMSEFTGNKVSKTEAAFEGPKMIITFIPGATSSPWGSTKPWAMGNLGPIEVWSQYLATPHRGAKMLFVQMSLYLRYNENLEDSGEANA